MQVKSAGQTFIFCRGDCKVKLILSYLPVSKLRLASTTLDISHPTNRKIPRLKNDLELSIRKKGDFLEAFEIRIRDPVRISLLGHLIASGMNRLALKPASMNPEHRAAAPHAVFTMIACPFRLWMTIRPGRSRSSFTKRVTPTQL